MEWQELTGYFAGILTSIAVIPQISKAMRTKQVDDISVVTVSILIWGLSLWVIYGWLARAWPVVVTNGLSALMNIYLLWFVLQRRSR
jgi:MtN3 and saliva related transmembrane protein